MNAMGVELLLFNHDIPPARVIRVDPYENRTYYYCHLFVREVHAGQIYAYRTDGAFDPASGPLVLMPRETSSLR
jgi:isoamylase